MKCSCLLVKPFAAELILSKDTYKLLGSYWFFSNSCLCCGLAPKPTHCLNDDTANTSTCPSQTTWYRQCWTSSAVLRYLFVFWSKQGRVIANTCREIMSNSPELNFKHIRLCVINVSLVWMKAGWANVFGQINISLLPGPISAHATEPLPSVTAGQC